jgi:hypothetical protein
MTVSEAIRLASRFTQLDHYDRQQYRVRWYDESRRAWWEGNITTRERALHELHEARISIALEALGFSKDDAGALANSATHNAYPKDWRACVRDELKADKLARSNAEV